MWPGLSDFQIQGQMWVDFVGSLLCSERFSPDTPVSLLLKKQNLTWLCQLLISVTVSSISAPALERLATSVPSFRLKKVWWKTRGLDFLLHSIYPTTSIFHEIFPTHLNSVSRFYLVLTKVLTPSLCIRSLLPSPLRKQSLPNTPYFLLLSLLVVCIVWSSQCFFYS